MIVSFSLNDSFFIHKSKRFESIYNLLVNKKHLFKMNELFTLAAAVGFKNNKRVKLEQKGTEMRSEHFKENQLAALYSIMLNSSDINADLESFRDYDFVKNAFKIIEEYSEGGMEILCDEVFEDKWNGINLDEEYNEYEIDLLRFVYDDYNENIGF